MGKRATALLSGQVTIDLDKSPGDLTPDKHQIVMLANSLDVNSEAGYQAAAAIVATCKQRKDAIEEFFEPLKKTANQAHKAICAREKEFCEPYVTARSIVEPKMRAYFLAQEAESRRIQQQVIDQTQEMRNDIEAQVRDLKRQGKMAEARALEQESQHIVDPILPDATLVAHGVTPRRPWEGKLDNIMELITAIAAGKFPLMHLNKDGEPEAILQINGTLLNHLARTQREAFCVPGCRAEEGIVFAAKAV